MVEPRLSAQTLSVLNALMSSRVDMAGADIARITGLSSGSLYPILSRLEDAGWLSSKWEDGEPAVLGRPRKRFYKVTGLGAKKLEVFAQKIAPGIGRLAWA